MPFASRFIAIDWGTTNRRIYVIDDGQVESTVRDDRGVRAVPPGGFEAEIAAQRASFGDVPVLMAGMIGANIGWRKVPYVDLPADAAALAAQVTWIDERTAIVPGVARNAGRADVMRGEEVQFLGAVAADLISDDAFVAQPGTHCKWATLSNRRIIDFTTSMTGELFALLRAHSLLAGVLTASPAVDEAFLSGVAEGRRRDLGVSLFGIRAASLLDRRNDVESASFTSGCLIGADVAARVEQTEFDVAHILDDGSLGVLYAAAVEANGKAACLIGSREAFVAGITAIGRLIT